MNAIETNIWILFFICNCSETTVAEKKEVVEVDAPKVVSEEEAPVDLVENGKGEEADASADAEKKENGSTEDNTDEVTSAAKDDEEEEAQNGDSNGKSNLFMFCVLFSIHYPFINSLNLSDCCHAEAKCR